MCIADLEADREDAFFFNENQPTNNESFLKITKYKQLQTNF